MENLEWRPVDPFGPIPKDLGKLFFLSDEHEFVYVGFTVSDYYDAKFWFPMPKYPFFVSIITNDAWITAINRLDIKESN